MSWLKSIVPLHDLSTVSTKATIPTEHEESMLLPYRDEPIDA